MRKYKENCIKLNQIASTLTKFHMLQMLLIYILRIFSRTFGFRHV